MGRFVPWTSGKTCREYGILLIEDCAQAHLASWRGRVAGSFGAAGSYSFYPTKNLGAVGDGGMMVTSDESVALHASQLRNYGQSERYLHPLLGMNSRLDEIHAAMLARTHEMVARIHETASADCFSIL